MEIGYIAEIHLRQSWFLSYIRYHVPRSDSVCELAQLKYDASKLLTA